MTDKPELTPLTPAEVADEKRICERATDEPWLRSYGTAKVVTDRTGLDICDCKSSNGSMSQNMDNASFVAHARTAYPRALATIEAQQTLLAEAHRIIDFVQRYWEPEPRVSDNENRDILGLMDAFMANPLVLAVEGGE